MDDLHPIRPAEVTAPHHHRLSPDGRWLATWNDEAHVFVVRAVDGSRPGGTPGELRTPFELHVAGAEGDVPLYRWLGDSRGFVLVTAGDLLVARFVPDDAPRHVPSERLLDAGGDVEGTVLDVRVTPSGFLVRTTATAAAANGRLFYFDMDRGGARHDLTPQVGRLGGGSIRSDGRLVVVVRDIEDPDRLGPGQLWTYTPGAGGAPVLVERRACRSEDCRVHNWAPGSERLVYAEESGRIVIERPGEDFDEVAVHVDPESPTDPVDILWTSGDGTRILGGTSRRLRAWDPHGRTVWSWAPPAGARIRSARFEPFSRAVLVGLDGSVLRLEEGRVSAVLVDERETAPSASYVDALPLPNGGAAVARLDRRSLRF